MQDPDFSGGTAYQLDFKYQPDGSMEVHMWEPGGSLHSHIGMRTKLSLDEVVGLWEVLTNYPDPDPLLNQSVT